MKKFTTTGLFILLMAISVFGQSDQDATNSIQIDSTIKEVNAQVFATDVIVQGSIAVGFDASSTEVFGFSTIKLKENNLRIEFDDTSSSGSFPGNDWELTANDSDNGGSNFFGITDRTAGTRPFSVEAGAGSNALIIKGGSGHVGFGTATPVVELQVTDGDSPTLRLEQNGASGFTPQTWDLAGNEANFFVRDVTNSSALPFQIKPGCPTSTLTLANGGNVGIGTINPEHKLEVAGDAQVNDFFYFGDESTDGNWRVSVIAGKLTFEKREAGVWVSKIEME